MVDDLLEQPLHLDNALIHVNASEAMRSNFAVAFRLSAFVSACGSMVYACAAHELSARKNAATPALESPMMSRNELQDLATQVR
jgi:hypothetical protein